MSAEALEAGEEVWVAVLNAEAVALVEESGGRSVTPPNLVPQKEKED